MFRLPSLPSLPLQVPGLSSEPPKLAFRNVPDGLARLSQQEISRDNTAYWKQYWVLFDSAEEVNTLITPQDIRNALQINPINIRTLLTVLIAHFVSLIRSPIFPASAPASSALPIPSWRSASAEEDETRAALNCARVIARILPVIWEDEGEWGRWLWEGGEEIAHPAEAGEEDGEGQFVIDDEDEEAGEETAAKEEGRQEEPTRSAPSPMVQLLDALVDGLFHAGFTLPADAAEGLSRTSYIIWASGVGSSLTPDSSGPIPTHRSTVLLTLLSALSHPLYTTPPRLTQQPSPTLAHLCRLPRKTYLALLCSLLNTALTPPAARYIGQVSREEDTLPQRAAQTLLVLLCQEGEALEPNVYQKALAKLHRAQDFEFVLEGIRGALDAEAAKGGLVNSVGKAVPVGRRASGPGALEAWLLAWRFVDLNKKFTNHLLSSTHLLPLLSHLLTTLTTYKDSPPHFALLRTLSYLLQSLTSHRALSSTLSSSPLPHSTATRASDALVSAVYALIASTNGQHAGLYQPLLISLANVAPYVKSLSVQSSSRLVALFQAFASPQFLIADEGNPRCVFWMLEFFTHIIHHQFSDNPNLIYAVLRTHERFQALATFTLSGALSEIARAKAAKEEHLRRTGALSPDRKNSLTAVEESSTPPMAAATEEEASERSAREEKERVREREGTLAAAEAAPEQQQQQPAVSPSPQPSELSEKARGKLRERSASVGSIASLGGLGAASANASGILGLESPTGFVATEEWVRSWVQGLPLDSILIAISELLPKIQDSRTPSSATAFLSSATLVGVLPPAPPILPRRFQWTEQSEVWRASLLWGQIYVASGPSQGPWAATQIRLFGIKQAPLSRRDQAIANVTNAMGSMWSAVGGQGRRPSRQGSGQGGLLGSPPQRRGSREGEGTL